MKNIKKQNRELRGSEADNVNSMVEQAKLKAGTHFKASDIAKGMAVDDSLNHVRLNSSSKSMDEAAKRFNTSMELILDANNKLLDESKRTEVQSKRACSSVKSMVNEIRDQLIKVDSILGDNVEHKIQQLERVALALKTISEISSDNKTMSIVSAMVNR